MCCPPSGLCYLSASSTFTFLLGLGNTATPAWLWGAVVSTCSVLACPWLAAPAARGGLLSLKDRWLLACKEANLEGMVHAAGVGQSVSRCLDACIHGASSQDARPWGTLPKEVLVACVAYQVKISCYLSPAHQKAGQEGEYSVSSSWQRVLWPTQKKICFGGSLQTLKCRQEGEQWTWSGHSCVEECFMMFVYQELSDCCSLTTCW